jgi:hypothetical protein
MKVAAFLFFAFFGGQILAKKTKTCMIVAGITEANCVFGIHDMVTKE